MSAIKSEGEPNIWYCNADWCYMVSAKPKKFGGAKSYCRRHDSNISSITSAEENEEIADICGCRACWIGFVERTEGD